MLRRHQSTHDPTATIVFLLLEAVVCRGSDAQFQEKGMQTEFWAFLRQKDLEPQVSWVPRSASRARLFFCFCVQGVIDIRL